MEHEWEPPCGLKPRLALAFDDVGDLELFAEYLDVTPEVAQRALYDEGFTPTPDDLATMWANLPNVAGIGEHHKSIGFTPGRSVEAWESALWSATEIDNLPISNYVREFRWVY